MAVLTAPITALGALVARCVTAVPPAVMAIVYVALIPIITWKAYGAVRKIWKDMDITWAMPVWRVLSIALALHASYLSYGVLKEILVTQDRIASPVLVLSSRFISVVFSAGYLLISERQIKIGAPLHSMSFFAFTNEMSTWAGYEVLKYVSFPIQVMAKSIKMLPNMLMGRILRGRRYPTYQYIQAVVATAAVGIMHFADDGHSPDMVGASSAADTMDPTYKFSMGVAILMVFFVCDSFTSQWQAAVYEKHPNLTQTHMMLGGNLVGLVLTASTLVASWPKVVESVATIRQAPYIAARVAALGVVSSIGQFCIYSAIKILGPVSFAWIMTARQLLSVLISLVLFHNGLSALKLVCIVIVFGIMTSKQLSKIPEKMDEMGQVVRKNSRDFLGQLARRSSTFSANFGEVWSSFAQSATQ